MSRIAFLSTWYHDATRRGAWSGIPFRMREALAAQAEVVDVRLQANPDTWTARARTLLAQWRGQRRLRDRDPRLLRALAAERNAGVESVRASAVVAATSLAFAEGELRVPGAFWTDACFPNLVGYYASFSRLSESQHEEGLRAERAALERVAVAAYATEWAAAAARALAPAQAHKVHVIPLGSNLDAPSAEAVAGDIGARCEKAELRLLFVGVDWERKGGDHAVAVADALRERGRSVRLTCVGAPPPRVVAAERPWLRVRGFLDPATAAGRAELGDLFREAHWLVLPSRAECFGIVVAEAAAHGVPTLATRTGGLAEAVAEGVNGRLFTLDEPASAWAEAVLSYSKPGYSALAASARRDHETRLNWAAGAARLLALLRREVRP